MADQLFMEERRRLILEALETTGRVSVSALAEQLKVSAVTIRQDLNALEADGLLSRTHGGAVAPETPVRAEKTELSFDIRRTKQLDEKQALGKAAAALVETGSAIALDASTTVCQIVPHLRGLDSLTVVTNNLMVTDMVLSNRNIEVLLPGGRLRRDSYSIVGAPESLPAINLNIGFLSAWGIADEAGLTEASAQETEMKQALLSLCLMKVVLVDSGKWGQVAPYTYAQPKDIDIILTTNRTPDEALRPFKNAEVRVVALDGMPDTI